MKEPHLLINVSIYRFHYNIAFRKMKEKMKNIS